EQGNYYQNNASPKNTRMEADIDYMGLIHTKPSSGSVNAGLEWEPLEGLIFNTLYAIQKTWWNQTNNEPRYNLGWAARNYNSLSFKDRRTDTKTFNVIANYTKSFGNHYLN